MKRIRTRKFCLLLSYCGKNYFGMQRNPGTKTIEEPLMEALRDCELISEEQFHKPQDYHFQRAARTDKSVSAIRQICSMKVKETLPEKIEALNEKLPRDIRVMGVRRVTQAFCSKNYCDARTYSYLMPSLALAPPEELTTEKFKASGEIIKRFNNVLCGYVGNHPFHNFTSGKKPDDPSVVRKIHMMECSDPFYPCNQNELEFILVRVKGQSFMMHQIRKMIGLAIAVMKGFASEEHIKKSFEPDRMDIPKAPGVGLMLEETHFDRYNKRFGGDGQHDPIKWESLSDKIDDFKNELIYPVVVEAELNEKSMLQWLGTLSLHTYGPRIEGSIPIEKRFKSGDYILDTFQKVHSVTTLTSNEVEKNEAEEGTDAIGDLRNNKESAKS